VQPSTSSPIDLSWISAALSSALAVWQWWDSHSRKDDDKIDASTQADFTSVDAETSAALDKCDAATSTVSVAPQLCDAAMSTDDVPVCVGNGAQPQLRSSPSSLLPLGLNDPIQTVIDLPSTSVLLPQPEVAAGREAALVVGPIINVQESAPNEFLSNLFANEKLSRASIIDDARSRFATLVETVKRRPTFHCEAFVTAQLSPSANERNGMLDPETMERHMCSLVQFQDRLKQSPVFSSLYMDHALSILSRESPSDMYELVGAMRNLSLYSDINVSPRLECVDPGCNEALRAANERARELHQPMIQPSVAAHHISIAVEQEPRRWVKAALIIMWLTSSWPGCALQLRAGNVLLDPLSGKLSVKFVEGKAVVSRGSEYTATCVVPREWTRALQEYIYQRCVRQRAKDDDLLFPATSETPEQLRTARILDALRVAHPALNLRGLRRGSLEAFSAAGATPEDLRARCGHANVITTQRYFSQTQRSREMSATIAPASVRPRLQR